MYGRAATYKGRKDKQKSGGGHEKPNDWPANEAWPPTDADGKEDPINVTIETYPAIYVLKSGREVPTTLSPTSQRRVQAIARRLVQP